MDRARLDLSTPTPPVPQQFIHNLPWVDWNSRVLTGTSKWVCEWVEGRCWASFDRASLVLYKYAQHPNQRIHDHPQKCETQGYYCNNPFSYVCPRVLGFLRVIVSGLKRCCGCPQIEQPLVYPKLPSPPTTHSQLSPGCLKPEDTQRNTPFFSNEYPCVWGCLGEAEAS